MTRIVKDPKLSKMAGKKSLTVEELNQLSDKEQRTYIESLSPAMAARLNLQLIKYWEKQGNRTKTLGKRLTKEK